MADLDVFATLEAFQKATNHLDALCAGRAKFRMSIPANPDKDTDLIFADAISAGENALAKVERLRADLAAALEHHRLTVTGVWDDTVPPGGYVCGYCGTPVESQPCGDHEAAPSTPEPDRTPAAVERTDAGCDSTGMTDHGAGASS